MPLSPNEVTPATTFDVPTKFGPPESPKQVPPVEVLFDSNRFRFVEDKPEMIKDVLDRQWMSSAGMVDQSSAVEMGRILGAKKVIYGEVYDL